MDDSCLIKCKLYYLKGRPVFHLSLEFGIEFRRLTIVSNLPNWICNRLVLLPNISEAELFPEADEGKVQRILDNCAAQIFSNPIFTPYYYPPCFLSNNRVIPNILWTHSLAIAKVFNKDYKYLTAFSAPHLCHYLFVLINNQRNGILNDVYLTAINREAFELFLDAKMCRFTNEYLDMHFILKTFIEISSNSHEPSFVAGLDRNGRVMIAIIQSQDCI